MYIGVTHSCRSIIEYDRDRRPDVFHTAADAIVVSTSALQTGTNLAPTNLVLFYGIVYSLEDLLQGAGRGGRCPESQASLFFDCLCPFFNFTVQGVAILLGTPYAVTTALNMAKKDKDPSNAKRRIQEVML